MLCFGSPISQCAFEAVGFRDRTYLRKRRRVNTTLRYKHFALVELEVDVKVTLNLVV